METSAKFDRQAVIEKATNLFWEKGFHGTSMRTLQTAIDMRPGSIYAAFGSKEGLFKESLQFYARAGLARLNQCAQTCESPLAALKHFFDITVTRMAQPAPSDMCMLVKAVAELTADHAELLAESKKWLGIMETAMTDLLLQAQQQGEIHSHRDVSRLARFLQMQLMGLRAYVHTKGGSVAAEELIDDIFRSVTA